MKKYNITILGCSVALRVRPPLSGASENKGYPKRLEEILNQNNSDTLFSVNNLSISRGMVYEFIARRDQIVQTSPDFILLNFGAVESPNREIPRWFSDVIFHRTWRSLYKPFFFLYTYVIARYLRRPLVYVRGKRRWLSATAFERKTIELIQLLKKETSATIVVLDVNRGNATIDKMLPGSVANYEESSVMLRKVAKKENIVFIPVDDLNGSDHYPDGVHYNVEGHRLIANRIAEIIQKNSEA